MEPVISSDTGDVVLGCLQRVSKEQREMLRSLLIIVERECTWIDSTTMIHGSIITGGCWLHLDRLGSTYKISGSETSVE